MVSLSRSQHSKTGALLHFNAHSPPHLKNTLTIEAHPRHDQVHSVTNDEARQAATLQHSFQNSTHGRPVEVHLKLLSKNAGLHPQAQKRDQRSNGDPGAYHDRAQLLGHLNKQYHKKAGTKAATSIKPQASHWYNGQI